MLGLLDSACPISWRRKNNERNDSSPSGANAQSSSASVKGTVQIASSSLLTYPGTLDRQRHDSTEKTAKETNSSSLHEWIARRYAEALWLGEHHSPLVGFLRHVEHIETKTETPSDFAALLASLLLPRKRIRCRLSGSVDSLGLASHQCINRLITIDEDILDDEMITSLYPCKSELRIVKAALQSGPAHVVQLETQGYEGDGLGKFGRLWINASETRELKLQILVHLCLLQLHARHPDLTKQDRQKAKGVEQNQQRAPEAVLKHSDVNSLESSSSKIYGGQDISPTHSQKKRKRKIDKAHRWTGNSHIFPWQVSRSATIGSVTASSKESTLSYDKVSSDPNELSKQFEALVDALCLRVSTVGVALDLDADVNAQPCKPVLSDAPQRIFESPAATVRRKRKEGHRVVIPPFGSEGRKRESEKDERDVLQWFCCHVVEAKFSKTLPRQCGKIRSRCYVPSALTPAKPTKQGAGKSNGRQEERKRAEEHVQSRGGPSRARNAKDVTSRTALSPTPEPKQLQRSLLNEDRESLRKTRDVAAAKRQNTWVSREVNVRRRWERSVSLGQTMTESLQSVPSRTHNLAAIERIEESPNVVQSTDRLRNIPSSTLVLDTPAKTRTVNMLAASSASNILSEREGKEQQVSSQQNSHTRRLGSSSPWRRSESQPVFSLDSLGVRDAEQNGLSKLCDDDMYKPGSSDEDGHEDELLDESLQQVYSGDESDEDHCGPSYGKHDVFQSYVDWLVPSNTTTEGTDPLVGEADLAAPTSDQFGHNTLQNRLDMKAEMAEEKEQEQDQEEEEQEEEAQEEEEERLILAKRVRSLPPSSFWAPVMGTLPSPLSNNDFTSSIELETAQKHSTDDDSSTHAATTSFAKSSPCRRSALSGRIISPHRFPTGRNPFAKRD